MLWKCVALAVAASLLCFVSIDPTWADRDRDHRRGDKQPSSHLAQAFGCAGGEVSSDGGVRSTIVGRNCIALDVIPEVPSECGHPFVASCDLVFACPAGDWWCGPADGQAPNCFCLP